MFVSFLLMLMSCAAQPGSEWTPIPNETPSFTRTTVPVPPTFTATSEVAAPTPFICDEDWQSFPIIPAVSDAARSLYQQGVAQGNHARAFSKIGDGEISTDWFLTAFELGSGHYDLGKYQSLEVTLEYFQGSFERHSMAAQRGFNTNLILDPAASDPALCQESESPLDCELRIHNPSMALLSLGTNQVHRPGEFESGMRSILEILISKNILPILSTKGDNLEGDHRINRTIACLAQEYQLPLWNFWVAIQPLPNHGLQSDLEHLTYSGTNDFGDPAAMKSAWTVRNLTALQTLEQVWKSVHR